MLTTLAERAEASAWPLPASLTERYGGPLGFPSDGRRPYAVANFVATLDGVISYGLPGRSDAALISAKDPADRFVMGLLRACADAVVVGAGTLRAESRHVWTPDHIFPSAAADYAALRRALGKPTQPLTVFVSGTGELDLGAAAFGQPSVPVLVLTTEAGAGRLRPIAPAGVEVRTLGAADRLTAGAVLEALAAREAELVLTEGGPGLMATFLAERRLDELFLTLAPQIAGRAAREPRLGVVEGLAFAPEEAPWARLVSVKAAGDYLFLRYRLDGARPAL